MDKPTNINDKITNIYDSEKASCELRFWNAAQRGIIHYFISKGYLADPEEWITSGAAERFERYMKEEKQILSGADEAIQEFADIEFERLNSFQKIKHATKEFLERVQELLIGKF